MMRYHYKNGRNSGRVISVAASPPNNVNTSKSIALLVKTCMCIATINLVSEMKLHSNTSVACAIKKSQVQLHF